MSNNNNNYFYNANVPAAYLFSVLFGICLLLHIFQLFKYHTKFMIVLIIGVAMEFVGYITRIISIQHPNPQWSIIVSSVGLIVPPAFMAAQDYMIIGRVMSFVGSEYAYIKHTKITKLFVSADVFAILTQATGGSVLGSANGDISKLKLAKKILLGGLALQVITFGIFLFVAIAYDVRSSNAPALRAYKSEMKRLRLLWNAFYVTGILITGRSIYRTAEFASVSFTAGESDPQGYAVTHEWLFYVFDSVPIFFSVLLFAIFHPGRFLPSKKGLRMDGTFEEQLGRRRFLCCGPHRTRAPRGPSSEMALRPV